MFKDRTRVKIYTHPRTFSTPLFKFNGIWKHPLPASTTSTLEHHRTPASEYNASHVATQRNPLHPAQRVNTHIPVSFSPPTKRTDQESTWRAGRGGGKKGSTGETREKRRSANRVYRPLIHLQEKKENPEGKAPNGSPALNPPHTTNSHRYSQPQGRDTICYLYSPSRDFNMCSYTYSWYYCNHDYYIWYAPPPSK